MKRTTSYFVSGICMIAMTVLILDSKTAALGAQDGIRLCLRTVIPSLFPFFLLSIMLQSHLPESSPRLLSPLGSLCGLPRNSEMLLLVGLVGGYPVGAHNLAQAHRSGRLSRSDTLRMLGFCSNAGPAFIFGMLTPLFTNPLAPLSLWLIHIVSALLVGAVLPGKSDAVYRSGSRDPVTVTEGLQKAIKITASVCGWVVIFRIIIKILDRWFFWMLPDVLRVILVGTLELSNGCIEAASVANEGTRFLICSALLALGGLCVALQTVSVTQGIGLGKYIPGKLLQTLISLILAAMAQGSLYSDSGGPTASIGMILILMTAAAWIGIKKTVAKRKTMMYNRENTKEVRYAVPKKTSPVLRILHSRYTAGRRSNTLPKAGYPKRG